jgi:hypothetical protein
LIGLVRFSSRCASSPSAPDEPAEALRFAAAGGCGCGGRGAFSSTAVALLDMAAVRCSSYEL